MDIIINDGSFKECAEWIRIRTLNDIKLENLTLSDNYREEEGDGYGKIVIGFLTKSETPILIIINYGPNVFGLSSKLMLNYTQRIFLSEILPKDYITMNTININDREEIYNNYIYRLIHFDEIADIALRQFAKVLKPYLEGTGWEV